MQQVIRSIEIHVPPSNVWRWSSVQDVFERLRVTPRPPVSQQRAHEPCTGVHARARVAAIVLLSSCRNSPTAPDIAPEDLRPLHDHDCGDYDDRARLMTSPYFRTLPSEDIVGVPDAIGAPKSIVAVYPYDPPPPRKGEDIED